MYDGMNALGDIALNQAQQFTQSAIKGRAVSVDKASTDFEGMFMAQMLQPMFEGIGVNPIFGGGHGEEIMRSFLVQEYGKLLAQQNKSGIAAAVKKELIAAQEHSSSFSDIKGVTP